MRRCVRLACFSAATALVSGGALAYEAVSQMVGALPPPVITTDYAAYPAAGSIPASCATDGRGVVQGLRFFLIPGPGTPTRPAQWTTDPGPTGDYTTTRSSRRFETFPSPSVSPATPSSCCGTGGRRVVKAWVSMSVKKTNGPTFDIARDQALLGGSTGAFAWCQSSTDPCTTSGVNRLQVAIPPAAVTCNFQLDLVIGAPLETVGPHGSALHGLRASAGPGGRLGHVQHQRTGHAARRPQPGTRQLCPVAAYRHRQAVGRHRVAAPVVRPARVHPHSHQRRERDRFHRSRHRRLHRGLRPVRVRLSRPGRPRGAPRPGCSWRPRACSPCRRQGSRGTRWTSPSPSTSRAGSSPARPAAGRACSPSRTRHRRRRHPPPRRPPRPRPSRPPLPPLPPHHPPPCPPRCPQPGHPLLSRSYCSASFSSRWASRWCWSRGEGRAPGELDADASRSAALVEASATVDKTPVVAVIGGLAGPRRWTSRTLGVRCLSERPDGVLQRASNPALPAARPLQ